MRVFAIISYDGSKFQGFQKQSYTNATVANQIENVLRSCNIDTKLVASGRTDRGVHATHQVLHFKLPYYWSDCKKLQKVLNAHLIDSGIYFKTIFTVSNKMHARYSANRRSYQYLIKKRVKVFERDYFANYTIDSIQKFSQALQRFEKKADFALFSKSGSGVKTTVRTIYKTRVLQYKDCTICYIQADGFLRSQVRLMIQAALEVAMGRATLEDIDNQLMKKKLRFSKPASANGLYLTGVSYRV